MIGLGLGHHLAQLGDRSGQITLHHLRAGEPPPALPRSEPVPDRVGDVASFFAGRAHRNRIPGHERRMRLLAEDLAQPPPVSDCAGQADRLGEVWPGHLGVVDGGCAAGGAAPGPAGPGRRLRARSPGLARRAPGCRWRPTRRARPCRRAPARAPRAPPRSGVRCRSVRTASNQASPSWMRPARQPQRLQRRRQLPTRSSTSRVLAAPRERGSQVVDLGRRPARGAARGQLPAGASSRAAIAV